MIWSIFGEFCQGLALPGMLPGPLPGMLPGPIPGKVIQSTGSKSMMPGDPWHGLWPCRDQGLIPVGFARAVQPWVACSSTKRYPEYRISKIVKLQDLMLYSFM